MTTTTARTSGLRAARAKDSQDKRRRVIAAVQALEAAAVPITAAAVATAAGVSTWLVYADGIREHLDAARQRQSNHPGTPIPATPQGAQPSATPASLRTDLAVARAEIRRLRADHDNSATACAYTSSPRSKDHSGPSSSPGSRHWKPATANS